MSLSKETPYGCNRHTILPSVKTIYVYNLDKLKGRSAILNFTFDTNEISFLSHGLNEYHLCNEILIREFQRNGNHFGEKHLQIYVCPDSGFQRNFKMISLNTTSTDTAYFLVFDAQNNNFPKLFDLVKTTITNKISFLPFVNFTTCTTHSVYITICHSENAYEAMHRSCICRKTSNFRF